MSDERRVLVVGAGIGGLSAATALRHAGLPVHVFEQGPELRDIGAGVGLQVVARKALDWMGFGDTLKSISGHMHKRLELKDRHGKVLAVIPQEAVTVHRRDLLLKLGEPLIAAGDIELESRVVAFEQDAGGVTARLEDGREERGAVLVGADGIHSLTREGTLGKQPQRYSGFTVWRAIPAFEHQAVAGGLSQQAFGRGSLFGMFPSSLGRVYWFASRTAPEGERDAPEGRKAELLSLFRGWYEPVEQLIEATPDDEIDRKDIYDRPPADRWGEGRVTLLGDAAHATLPTLGQGAGQAIEDSAVLAQRLAERCPGLDDGAAIDAALRDYERTRMPRTAKVVNDSWKISRTYRWSNPVVVWGRDMGLKLTPNKVWAKEAEEEEAFDLFAAPAAT
jgi:2-polyprenyl-6-methoxyphenol hydroxylase-like FAD-dependent oxidoreductase